MANRIQIRRGSGAPSGSLNYELGWDTTNKILYINDGGTDKAAALPLTGGTLSGTLHFKNLTTGNYTEGIRLHPSSNGWNALVFCGTDNTGDNGTSANTWGLYANQGNFSISKNQSQNGTTYLQNIDNDWSLGGNLTISKSDPCLYVKNTDMDTSTTTNSANTYNQIFFVDKAGRLNGFLQGVIGTDAAATFYMGVRTKNSDNSGNVQQHFGISIAKNGTASTYFSHSTAWRTGLGVPAMTTETYPALLPTNGTNSWIKVGTSNTSYGLLPSQGGGAGSGHNSLGTSTWYWKYAYIDEIYGHLNGTATSVALPIYFGSTGMNSCVLGYSSTYPKYGIWYNDATTDKMRFSASGNADTDAGADLCINGNGDGTVTIRGKTILHTNNYSSYALPLSGGTITGTLRVGVSSAASSSSHSLWTTGIHVHDTRYDAISVTSLSHAANFFFSNNGMPSGSAWWAGMHLAGWEGDYSAWELVGPASNADQRGLNLCMRIGRTSNGWGPWRALVTSSDATARRIWVVTSSGYSSAYANGDIVLVKV